MARINQSGLSEVRLQQKQRPKQYRRSKVLVLFSQACPASQDASLRHRVAGYEIFGSRQSQLPMTTVQVQCGEEALAHRIVVGISDRLEGRAPAANSMDVYCEPWSECWFARETNTIPSKGSGS